MSQIVPKMRQRQRLQVVEQNIIYLTEEEIAEKCGVSRKTIQRDVQTWRKNGGFDAFLMREFFKLYGIEKRINPSKALDRIMYLLARSEPAAAAIEKDQEQARRARDIRKLLAQYRSVLQAQENNEHVNQNTQ